MAFYAWFLLSLFVTVLSSKPSLAARLLDTPAAPATPTLPMIPSLPKPTAPPALSTIPTLPKLTAVDAHRSVVSSSDDLLDIIF